MNIIKSFVGFFSSIIIFYFLLGPINKSFNIQIIFAAYVGLIANLIDEILPNYEFKISFICGLIYNLIIYNI